MCHNSRLKSGNLTLANAAGLFAGGVSDRPFSQASPKRARYKPSSATSHVMPKSGPPLAADQIATFGSGLSKVHRTTRTASRKSKPGGLFGR